MEGKQERDKEDAREGMRSENTKGEVWITEGTYHIISNKIPRKEAIGFLEQLRDSKGTNGDWNECALKGNPEGLNKLTSKQHRVKLE